MPLTKNTAVVYEQDGQNNVPVASASEIFLGSAVSDNGSGYAEPLVASHSFIGFAEQHINNTGAAGALTVPLINKGRVQLAVTGATTVSSRGSAVYASDSGTFTTTSSGNSFIGRIIRWVSAGIAVVEFDVPLVVS